MTTTEITSPTLLDSAFAKALVQQIRANDPYGTYRNWSDEILLKPFVVTRAQKRGISVEGEVDPITQGRIMAFYRAIAARIEQETGQLSQVVIDLSHEGFGWALVFSGRLLIVVRTLRDAQRFGFDSLEKLIAEGEKLVNSGIDLATNYANICKL
ncbi:NifX-associated nitrogen fixation protein [Desertifilum sp. FACHB-1129]|uniref:Nitrogen fixation protein n=1 Tax=Desertifilum tharense IPPAS B-1220 TaxID=1781255 RepID=A0A1E5QEN7_9CYAN|nr:MULTISPECIES: NifX-associated nitrogen fixation protein [Desertifilum]MCD8487234.1 NifX-associated nitrogen fixation protein [Desertifilum sp.]MDA0212692.1 NifX-associated nitrogen fixation protein [Cyanobacteria bacterium FC1]MBD2313078.1 NifX-associated nitrogen fixation protein [Desertifilum sp. FACHB-1129]MBD2324116.1 NifX-associated nitrogen fixation protein [Desertifilum sp. FACHB-866]MBD2334051.1 NifX-associated nitrogen fixation protein [Desertifilum sp. FACHB-868]